MSATARKTEVGRAEGRQNFLLLYGKGRRIPRPWLAPALVAVVAVVVYLSSLGNGFAYDDLPVIQDNPNVHDLLSPLRIWLTPYWPGVDALDRGLYRPLTIFLFGLQWSVGGGSPVPFHVMNVLLHSLASVLTYLLLDRFLDWRAALGAALLFAVHPVHIEAVANSVGQAELVSTCLVLMAAVLYMRRPLGGEVSGTHRRTIAGFFVLALLAKENAIVLPALLLLLDVAQRRVRRPGYLVSVAKLGFLLAAVAGVYLTLRTVILGGLLTGDPAVDLSFLQNPETRFPTVFSVWPHYLRLLLVPIQLSAMYDPATINPLVGFTPAAVVGLALFIFTGVGAILIFRLPGVGLGSAWFLATILPVSNLIFPIGTVLAERTLYLPSAALAIWVGFGLHWSLNRKAPSRFFRSLVAGSLGVVLVAFGVRTAFGNPVWSDSATLFEATFQAHPENFRAQWFHARGMVNGGDSTGSVQHWQRALAIYPGHSGFLTDYAQFLLDTGNLHDADDMVTQALKIRPAGPRGLFVQGLIDVSLGRDSLVQERSRTLARLGFEWLAEELADSLEAARRGATPDFPSPRR